MVQRCLPSALSHLWDSQQNYASPVMMKRINKRSHSSGYNLVFSRSYIKITYSISLVFRIAMKCKYVYLSFTDVKTLLGEFKWFNWNLIATKQQVWKQTPGLHGSNVCHDVAIKKASKRILPSNIYEGFSFSKLWLFSNQHLQISVLFLICSFPWNMTTGAVSSPHAHLQDSCSCFSLLPTNSFF